MHRIGVTIQGQSFEIELPPLPPAVAGGGSLLLARIHPVPANGTGFMPEPGAEPAPFETVELRWHSLPGGDWYLVDQRAYEVSLDLELRTLRSARELYAIEVRDLQARYARPVSGDGRVKAPIPGVITRVLVQAGDTVTTGQPLLILEAMKMQNEIRAPRAGRVSAVYVQPGDAVPLREVLIEII
jgi:biotin carboxyl carrier protein